MFVFAAEILLLLARIDLFESIAVLYPIVFHLISMQEETHASAKSCPDSIQYHSSSCLVAYARPRGS